jgi:TolB-like protein/AraC-like DNA-binding protein/Flp pilus assembly protein TadD
MIEHSTKDDAFIRKLTEIIHANLTNVNFGVKELARESGVSQYRLSRRLRSITNKTLNQFISETRLLKALDMLQNEEVTASEVAYKVGFSSPAYFSKCFHEFFGYPPGKLKKEDLNKIKELIPVRSIPGNEQKNYARRNITYVSAGFMILAALIYIVYNVFVKNSFLVNTGITEKHLEKSIAVLPFKNLSDSAANQYFIDGLMDEVLTKLSRIHDFRIISRTSVEQFRESNKSATEIAKKLKTDYIIEGSGQKYGNVFMLRIQLIDASRDKHIWAESYEVSIQETKDIFSVQNQVAQRVAAKLEATITPEEKEIIEHAPTASLTAYDYFLRGGEELRKYRSDPDDKPAIREAEQMFKNALAYDSAFAQAYSGLAEVYSTKHLYDSYFAKNYFDSVLILADRALIYNDHLAEAYYARGQYYLHNGKTEQAINEYAKALKYNPNYWEAYSFIGEYVYLAGYSINDFVKGLEYLHKAVNINRGMELPDLLRELGFGYLIYAGFTEEAKFYFNEAFKLDCDTTKYIFSLATIQSIYRNYPEAEELFKKCYVKDTDNIEIIEQLSNVFYLHDQSEELLKYVKKIKNRLDADRPLFHSSMKMIGYAYWQNGYKQEANIWFNEQISMGEKSIKMGRFYSIDANYDLAAIYAFRGEKEKAYQNLRKVNQIHVCPLWLLNAIKCEPLFNRIRTETEFQMIVGELEAKYQAEHEKVKNWLEKQGTL